MHVLPDSFDMLSSHCLSENPWHKFPFTGFAAMLSTLVTLMVDSVATSIYTNRLDRPPPTDDVVAAAEGDREVGNDVVEVGGAGLESNGEGGGGHFHHGHGYGMKVSAAGMMVNSGN
ncbi:unnamed protein product [Linum tenue]|uniref:Uncharacterized protein n=1 Tax=Linum tenue TaxID=586396 RepID=A0AAV0PHF3_9ROSI|nr:unnamed protein product [Linum tenue]